MGVRLDWCVGKGLGGGINRCLNEGNGWRVLKVGGWIKELLEG